ncbi:MAG: hypothetical protein R3B70_06335 [Polyangiaceae bacterium]
MNRRSSGGRAGRRWWLGAGLASCVGLLSGSAAADGAGEQEKNLAETLFQKGRDLMEAGNLKGACPKLAESQKLDPASGTLLYLAECYRRAGQTATAWRTLHDVRALAQKDGRAERIDVARAEIARLEKDLSYLTVNVSSEATAVSELTVECDGTAIHAAAFGVAVPVDPGTHKIIVQAPGYKMVIRDVVVQAGGDRQTVDVSALERLPKLPEPPSTGTPRSSAAPVIPPPVDSGKPLRTAGLAVGGVGLGALAIGAVLGGLAASNQATVSERCPSSPCSDGAAVDLNGAVRTQADASTVLFGAGGGLVALGALFYLLAPGAPPKQEGANASAGLTGIRPVVSGEGGGLWLNGQF